MDDIDSTWQSTEPTVVGAVQSKKPAKRAPQMQMTRPPSRRPAALVGILLMTVLGIVLLGGQSFFKAQVTDTSSSSSAQIFPAGSVQITITQDGVSPATVTVRPGTTIVWNNTADLPHIMEQKDLQDSDGNSLYTPAIFPGTKQAFTISSTQSPGTYDYDSATASDITGEIVVAGEPLNVSSTSPATSSTSQVSGGGTVTKKSSASSSTSSTPKPPATSTDPLLAGFILTAESSSKDPYAAPPGTQQVPVNPYTVGSTKTGPGDTSPLHQGAPQTPHPISQPASGSDTWSLALILTMVVAVGILLVPKRAR